MSETDWTNKLHVQCKSQENKCHKNYYNEIYKKKNNKNKMPKKNKGNSAKRKRDGSESDNEWSKYSPLKKKRTQEKKKKQTKKKEEKETAKQDKVKDTSSVKPTEEKNDSNVKKLLRGLIKDRDRGVPFSLVAAAAEDSGLRDDFLDIYNEISGVASCPRPTDIY